MFQRGFLSVTLKHFSLAPIGARTAHKATCHDSTAQRLLQLQIVSLRKTTH